MTSQRSTGATFAAAAGIQPVRPFGRPGTATRYQAGAPARSRRASRASTVRGWKSGRNWANVVTTDAERDGAVRTATLAHVSGPDPTTLTDASGESGAFPSSLPAPATGAAAAATTTARESTRTRTLRAPAAAPLVRDTPRAPDERALPPVLEKPFVGPVFPGRARDHRPVAEQRDNAHPVTEALKASLTPIPALLAFVTPSPIVAHPLVGPLRPSPQ